MSIILAPNRQSDISILERTVPAHMLVLMTDQCRKIGLELRADAQHRLNMASAAPLAKLDNFSVARLAKQTDDIATGLLNDLSPDDPREGLYCVVSFILKLVAEGRLADKTNMAVLVSLQLMDDIRDEKPDEKGEGIQWYVREKAWQTAAGKLLSRAVLQGLYHRRAEGVA